MKLAGLIRERDVWRAGTLLVLCVLVATLASLIAAAELMPTMREIVANGQRSRVQFDDAAARGWPSSTPHKTPWPDPIQIDKGVRFGVEQYSAAADTPEQPNLGVFWMKVTRSGWPWPVLERKEMGWDDSNPAWSGPEKDPPTSVMYAGLALDALALGGGAWLLIFGLLAAIVAWVRSARIRRGCCAFCGHQRDNQAVATCPSCHVGTEASR